MVPMDLAPQTFLHARAQRAGRAPYLSGRLLLVLETGAVEGFIRGVTNDGSHVETVTERLDPDE
jgi:hypothetical protein